MKYGCTRNAHLGGFWVQPYFLAKLQPHQRFSLSDNGWRLAPYYASPFDRSQASAAKAWTLSLSSIALVMDLGASYGFKS